MSKYKYEGYGVVRDTEIDFPYHTDDIVELLDEKDQNIADLEAKLAESEEKCKKAYQEGLLQKQFDKDMEIEQLKQQLAEKDKEIEYQESMKILAVENKNKKAIEQLEKVKENIHYLLSFDYNLLSKVNEQFDNQINELKEMK